MLLSVHILWGKNRQDRVDELKKLANWVEAYRTSKYTEDKDIFVMGDFNIPKLDDKFYNAIAQHGLNSPKPIRGILGGSNLDRKARYDQIFFYPEESGSALSERGGVVDFYAGNHRLLFPDLTKKKFTWQISDHLPLWLVINTDTDDEHLDQILNPPEKTRRKKKPKKKAKKKAKKKRAAKKKKKKSARKTTR